MDLNLTDRAYVVTAASQGLGFATAQALIDDGARVLIASRRTEALEAARGSLGDRAIAMSVDLSAPDAGERLRDHATEFLGSVDGLLVNVGGPSPGAALDYTDAEWTAAIDGVLLASVRVMRAFAPVIVDGGSILSVLSTTVREPILGLGASNVLRPGLAMLVKELSIELAPRVRVNGILPGRIATERMATLSQQLALP